MATLNRLIHSFLMLLIACYRNFIRPILGKNCRFDPSCSQYLKTALQQYGVFRGSYIAMKRLLRCHPWHSGGYDPVPKSYIKKFNLWN